MKRIGLVVCGDTIAFLIALFVTYVIYSTFQAQPISFLIIRAYGSLILLLWLFYMIILNFLGLYNFKKGYYSPTRILAASVIYFLSLLAFSYIYPKYQFSRLLIVINLTMVYFFSASIRLIIHRFFYIP